LEGEIEEANMGDPGEHPVNAATSGTEKKRRKRIYRGGEGK